MPLSLATPDLVRAMASRVSPTGSHVGCNAVLAVLAGPETRRLSELASLPLAALGHRIVALRYLIANGETWLRHFAWEPPLARVSSDAPGRLLDLWGRIEGARVLLADDATWRRRVDEQPLEDLAAQVESDGGLGDDALRMHVALRRYPGLAIALRERLRRAAPELHAASPRTCDLLYLATYDLSRLPATTVGEGALEYVIVADKGEMGARAVRVAIAIGATPVVLYNEADDARSLPVRLAREAGGLTIGLSGSFRESYANPTKIAARVLETYRACFGADADAALARSALYPGYGPLAENTAAIQCFRRAGIAFVGPMQDVVERSGDKRRFRRLAESIDPAAVTPGVVIQGGDAASIVEAIEVGQRDGRFAFPGRVKAANGGGGRGQVVVREPSGVPGAVQKVLGEIQANGWDPGVMFEENIPETVHLEVQVVRDRYGNTRHFGMRDCTEQRASQKIQEEAPPALLRHDAALEERITAIATRIADEVGYVGACTVELMFKDGRFYLLEMNTRIQVEHPVSEESHRVRSADGGLEPLDLVRLQLAVAAGAPIEFAQSDVVPTHVAREFRVNAESWHAELKDPRDGQRGLFFPNPGIFDVIELPTPEDVLASLREAGVVGLADLRVRFDVGFEPGDVLLNKDPTFGKLIVAVAADDAHREDRYELLRLASIEVLRRTRIEGRQVKPTGQVIAGSRFETNLADHVRILEDDVMVRHSRSGAPERHVGWVVERLRGAASPR